LTGFELVSLQK